MIRLAALAAACALPALASPALAQDHSGHAMPAPNMPAQTPAAEPAQPTQDHSGHAMHGMDHGAMPHQEESADRPTGTDLPAGNAPAPAPPTDHYADRQFPPADMARSRRKMMREEGGQSLSQIMLNLAEYRVVEGRDGYHWDGEAWFGGDINRLTLKSEGEGAFEEGLESAEIQVLYSRAIGPYFNLQAGLRHDIEPNPSRTHAVIGFEGLAPYWFEVEGALFLSDKGNLQARFEGYYDQRITQRLVLQPRAELNLSAQDIPESRIGAGLSSAEIGLRLRYEITRRFAPYVGISYEAKTGQTARYARTDGEDPTSTSLVAGLRIWF